MTDILFVIGLIIFVIGGIGFLIATFRTSLLWGLGCLIISPLQIIYLFVHWDSAKKPFSIQLVGGFVMLVTAYFQGNI
ncbi:MAG: putative membrane protein [Desulforhopalus sp.]|jgi:uncharacterized membrane protein